MDDSFAEVLRQTLSIEAKGRPESARAMLGRLENKFKTAEAIPKIQIPLESVILPPTPHVPSAVPQFQTLNTKPLQPPARRLRSSRKLIIAVLAAVAILCFVVTVALKMRSVPDPSPVLLPKKILQADCNLFSIPGEPDAKPIDTLPRNTKVLIENCRSITNKGKKGVWYQVKAAGSSKEGWIICKDEKECSEDKGICFSPE